MQTLSDIRALLDARGIRPKHRLGQNFLHDQNQIRRLVTAAALRPDALVLEVGPGTGALTDALLDTGAHVIACEIDADMAAIVSERVGEQQQDRFMLITGNALEGQRELNPMIVDAIAGRPFVLVANLPYQVASGLMTALLMDHRNCLGQFVTIQREVADRLTAPPSCKAYGPLGIIAQTLADIELIGVLSPSCFWPAPEVTSAMVAIKPHTDRGEVGGHERAFARFVVGLFSKRRKQLGSIIGRTNSAWPLLMSHGITPEIRPEALNVQQMGMLWRVVDRDMRT